MIECDVCGRRHRDEVQVDRCRLRAEKAAVRQAKKDADTGRRLNNQRTAPVARFVRDGRALGYGWDKIAAGLKKDYPPRPGGGTYSLWDVVEVYVRDVGSSWGVPEDVMIQMMLEKHVLGDYVTVHPLRLRGVQEALNRGGAVSIKALQDAFYGETPAEEEDG